VCALTDGLTPAEIDRLLGFEYVGKAELHWMRNAAYWTLLFVDSEREANWGMTTPVTAIRIPRQALADLRLPIGAKGTCVERNGIHARLSRAPAPVGVSPVTIRFAS